VKLSRPLFSTFLITVLLCITNAGGALGSPTEILQPIGSTTLKVFFWTIYDSTLFSDDGEYRGIEPGLALKIDYRRSVRREQLIKTTRDQWQELDLYDPDASEEWLQELAELWPDIQRDDSITLYVEADLSATFFYNDKALGQVNDPRFTQSFLAIWLAENSTFPKLRNQLIGLN
jgi:hypothetical protein